MFKGLIVFFLLTLQSFAEDHATFSLQRFQNKIVATIQHDSGWHTYWKNPGDAGIATQFKFTPELKAYEWPAPKKYLEAGDILTIGYQDKVHFFFDDIKKDISVKIQVLICKDICIPGSAELALKADQTFISSRPSSPFEENVLQGAFDQLPQEKDLSPKAEYYLTRVKGENSLYLHFNFKKPSASSLAHELSLLTPFPQAPLGFKREEFFLKDGDLYSRTLIEWDGDYQDPPLPLKEGSSLPQTYEAYFLFNNPESKKVEKIKLKLQHMSPHTKAIDDFYQGLKTTEKKSLSSSSESLFYYLALAFLGGLILNLMPCVLPVIWLKLYGLIQHQTDSKKKILKHNLAYTLGVITTFFILGLVITLLKKSGEQIGWGFQLQSPTFVSMMIVLLFLFTLNLFGLYEFRTPGGKFLGQVQLKEGFIGDFFSGVLSTILSTPCSAPFLGTALTFAFTSHPSLIFLIFFMIGLGLASPFLLTAFIPELLRFFPKPGAWMEKLKYFLGLSMLITVFWLYDVLGYIVDLSTSGLWLNLSLAACFFFFFCRKFISKNIFLTYFLILISLGLLSKTVLSFQPKKAEASTDTTWINWSEDKMNNQEGLVFVDFTAQWCLTCKVNKKLVLETQDFKDFAQEKGITLMRADWTNRDEIISEFLNRYGAVAVPAYFIKRSNGEILFLGETISLEKMKKSI